MQGSVSEYPLKYLVTADSAVEWMKKQADVCKMGVNEWESF